MQRFTTSTKTMDVESLGLICKVLCKYDVALDMLSLHAKISELVANAVAFVDDYDCETVGVSSSLCILIFFLTSPVGQVTRNQPRHISAMWCSSYKPRLRD